MNKRILYLCIVVCTVLFSPLSGQNRNDRFYSISVEDLYLRNYLDFPDLMFLQPGIWIHHTYPGQWASMQYRGGDTQQTHLTLNGYPIDDPWSGMADLSLIPVEMVDRIEIYPGSNPFGLTPIGGVVNIVEREYEGNRPVTRVVYRDGSEGFSDIDVTFGQGLGSRWNILSGLLLKAYGETDPGRSFKGQTFRTVVSFKPFSGMRLQYRLLNNRTDLDLPFGIPLPADTLFLQDPHRKRFRTDHRLEWTWNFKNIENTLLFGHSAADHEIRDMDFVPKQNYHTRTTRLLFRQAIRFEPVALDYGLRLRWRNWEASDSLKLNDSLFHTYLRAALPLTDALDIQAQINLHQSPETSLRLLFSSEIGWRPTDHFRLWVGYSEGVRDPSLGERMGIVFFPAGPQTGEQILMLHQKDLGGQLNNSALKPEIGRQVDLGIDVTFSRLAGGSVRGYWKRIVDCIRPSVSSSELVLKNLGESRIWGMESRLFWGPWHGFRGTIILNLQEATDESGIRIPERPQFWGNTSVGWGVDLFSKDLRVFLSTGVRSMSGFWRWSDIHPEDPVLDYQNGRFILDIKAIFTVLEHAVFSFSIDNVLSTEVAFVDHLVLPGRITRFGFSWNLFD